MRPTRVLAISLMLSACRTEGQLVEDDRELTLEVTSPTYGAFLRDAPAQVEGKVTPSVAVLKIEGEVVDVAEDGTFSFPVPIDHAYRIVDVEATHGDQWQRVRVPVFRGRDPLETWPGGMTMRLTPSGLSKLGEGLGAMVDAQGWDAMIADQLPEFDVGIGTLVPTGVTHDPTVVELVPAPVGLDVEVSFRNVDINYAGTVNFGFGDIPVTLTLGYDEIGLGAWANPEVDAAGMLSLTLSDPGLVFGQPDIQIAGISLEWAEAILAGAVGLLIGPLVEPLLDTLIDQVGTFDLGGPYVFETDLMGTPLEARLSDVFGDLGGLGAGLGVGLGEPAPTGPLSIPTPTSNASGVHAMVGLHEGVMHAAIVSGLLDQFTEDMELPDIVGTLVGNAVQGLPGGDDAPDDNYCLELEMQPARVVRLQTGIAPLAVLYMPDTIVNIGTQSVEGCDTWLKASLAIEAGIDVQSGTELSLDLQIVEGAVLEYGAEPGWDEAEVVAGLSQFMGTAMGLLGSQLSFDLADMMGGLGDTGSDDPLMGALGDLDLRIVDSQPLLDGNQPVEGLYAVSLQLWTP